MFQPQPTAFSPFNPYGVQVPPADFQCQPTGLASGGPTVFHDPIFSPAATHTSTTELNFTHNHNSAHRRPHAHPKSRKIPRNRMNDDLAAQEALARDFQPDLSVRFPCVVLEDFTTDS